MPIDKLGGIVEVDETFVGGLAKNRHWDKRGELFHVLHMAYEEGKKLADELLDEEEQ